MTDTGEPSDRLSNLIPGAGILLGLCLLAWALLAACERPKPAASGITPKASP